MTDSNIKHLALLGKEVSFCFSSYGVAYQTDGQVTSLVLHLHGDHEISVDDDGEFYSFSDSQFPSFLWVEGLVTPAQN